MLTALCIFGTRPDAIKMAPVVLQLRSRPDRWSVITVVTGQHREQLDQVLQVFGIVPDRDLAIMQPRQTLAGITTRALAGLDEALTGASADVVLAQGDTTTTFVAALAAFYHRIPFGHVEAGLRTGSIYDPFPEEMNRRLAADIATFHFAPTEEARGHLLCEGIPDARIHITGNTGIDALLAVAGASPAIDDPEIGGLIATDARIVLITAHRRENCGAPLESICRAVAQLSRRFGDVQFVYAMHRNPVVRDTVQAELTGLANVHLVEPPSYAPFVKLMQRSSLILTDSGGIQEEAPSLGVPVLVLRRTTERPEGVAAGAARLIGADRERIVAEAGKLLSDPGELERMRVAENPYGDGHAAQRIRLALEADLN
ncbi:MAG: UDP-N-acetylglucosamine 2-epimerase (non-hydrolyzing) [Armatimonadetes bacterium]|nr:UDP-N-acetylglucosamine 2-epimerase (non-hydrolyzing) [Armatimonadota bacterium]